MEQLELTPEASAVPRAEASEASGGGGTVLVPVSNLYAEQRNRVERLLQAAGVSLPCERPILVIDRESGETVKVRCGTRRAAECVSCAALYSGDASAILRAGALDAEPGTVIVMLTLTAPSFGAVHRVPKEASPRLRADAQAAWQARAGRTKCRCGQAHAVGDRLAGVALDVDSYDYEGQAAWNAGFGRLWNRTATRLTRDRCGTCFRRWWRCDSGTRRRPVSLLVRRRRRRVLPRIASRWRRVRMTTPVRASGSSRTRAVCWCGCASRT